MPNKKVRSTQKVKKRAPLSSLQTTRPGSLDRRLKDYSLAAAGVSALALASPAQAAIVSTTPNTTIPLNGVTPIYAPITGFPAAIKIVNSSNSGSSLVAVFPASATPAFFGGSSKGSIAPASVGLRVPTGLTRFTGPQRLVFSSEKSSDTNFLGANKYLGFSVGTGASIHYGWLKFTIADSDPGYTVVLNQVAIEECATQPIAIGTSSGGASCPAPSATPIPNSLWLMSLGIAGLAGLEALRRLKKPA